MLTAIGAGALFFTTLVISTLLLILPSRYERNQPTSRNPPSDSNQRIRNPTSSVQIVVLGDIGRSPRMQYHALSIANHNCDVSLIGYTSSAVHPDLVKNPRVAIVPLASPPNFLRTSNRYLFPVLAALKLLHQTWCLWLAVAYRSKPAQWMLVQNPPAAPTLVIAHLVCKLRNSCLIIDWHNFGYSILALKLGKGHPMVKINKSHEASFGRLSAANFCVSKAMARQLRDDLKIKAPILVLHDRPPALFQPFQNDDKKYAFLSSLPETSEFVRDMRNGACRLLVSSTSWTPDEDFSILIDALCRYSAISSTVNYDLPRLGVIITGKGPQRDMYLSRVANLMAEDKLNKVVIKSAWLSLQDYAQLLASASLGVCLHTSTSGVDLPMKVVDMFGAGLPVVGWSRYESWPELVTEGINGLGFGSPDELLAHLLDLFGDDGKKLAVLRQGALQESKRRWDDEWDAVAGKLFDLDSLPNDK
ncbi:chitobiosyldiphosphodolichol beta-1,4 mannosyltransferase [Paracoccidioides brasiliensis Pb18]|uniref:Chitobiosyldiphosphodolichol beta-mannosyltransferase n=1 Tax=Paracoccidioides brasiliensis (strain Pb18) TaxID=502780 RepID=C1GGE3_PARBD|nr:chitobiosyldiphosphodolichol beta-1,4 mannosyltransferase [Paracoccidioides brasiliensis Pb18]EEH50301.2 hypothetical protein PADG_06380 [Paracoccidioides brasiliensis Pb18]